MLESFHRMCSACLLGLAVAYPTVSQFLFFSPAFAQASDMAGIAHSESISARATVKKVDQQTRMVTLETPGGNSVVLKVGDQVRNLAQVRPGDTVVAHYNMSSAYVLAPPGAKLPDNSLTVGGERAALGDKPGAAIGSKIVVSGLVVGIDPTLHTVSLVDPTGGSVRSVSVVTPDGQESMKLIKVGDTITAIITEAVLVGVEPAA
jgi:Cu/Ag efflux protein CusF